MSGWRGGRRAALLLAAVLASVASARASGPGVSLVRPVWSPDSRHVAWQVGFRQVWVARADGSQARQLHFDGVEQMTWETGSTLLVDSGFQLFRLRLDGHARQVGKLTDNTFSTDASRRHVASGTPCPNCTGSVRVLDLKTGKTARVGSPKEDNKLPALSPDGRFVAYSRHGCTPSYGPCARDLGLWVADASGAGKPRRIAPSGRCAVWSPDGRSIAFVDAAGLEVMGASGGHKRTIARGVLCLPPVLPSFSPNSRFLAFNSVRNVALNVADLRSHMIILRSPARFRGTNGHTWSPDAKTLLVSAEGPSCASLWRVDVRSGRWTTFRAC